MKTIRYLIKLFPKFLELVHTIVAGLADGKINDEEATMIATRTIELVGACVESINESKVKTDE